MLNRPHYPALPRRFRRARLLIVGCGDIGLRLGRLEAARGHHAPKVLGTVRNPEKAAALRASGITPLRVDLDARPSLARLRGLATRVVQLAPPPATGDDDPRTRRLLAVLSRRTRSLVYMSTTGVYGDTQGACFDETRPVAPASDRARRRVAAEVRVRGWLAQRAQAVGRARSGAPGDWSPPPRAAILRVPGIYGHDRLPLERLQRGLPALRPEDDVWTNHIHADDLARISRIAQWRARGGRVFHAVDDSRMRMGDYFDAVADAFALPRPERLSREEIARRVTPAMLSFMSESRVLLNRRLSRELRVRLRWPTVADTLATTLL